MARTRNLTYARASEGVTESYTFPLLVKYAGLVGGVGSAVHVAANFSEGFSLLEKAAAFMVGFGAYLYESGSKKVMHLQRVEAENRASILEQRLRHGADYDVVEFMEIL